MNTRRICRRTMTNPLIEHTQDECQVRPREHTGPKCGPLKVSLTGLMTEITVVYIRDKCLLCGELGPKGGWVEAQSDLTGTRWDANIDSDGWIFCRQRGCGFGIHKPCRDFINVLCNFSTNSTYEHRVDFECNDVFCQMGVKDISAVKKDIRANDVNTIKKKVDTKHKSFVIWQRKRKAVVLRYSNDMSECRYCGNFYDIQTNDHLMNDCPIYFLKATENGERIIRPSSISKRVKLSSKNWPDKDVMGRLIFFHTHHVP